MKCSMENKLNELGNRVRRITCKVNKHDGKRVWTVSLYGQKVEVDGRLRTLADEKYTGATLEEALSLVV